MSDNFFPEDVMEASEKIGGGWLKGSDFDGEGQELQLAKPLEKVAPSNPKYGADKDNFLVKNELLEVGQTFRYSFKSKDGLEKQFDSTSTPFFVAFKQCEGLAIGDWVIIKRTGKTTETRYTVEKKA